MTDKVLTKEFVNAVAEEMRKLTGLKVAVDDTAKAGRGVLNGLSVLHEDETVHAVFYIEDFCESGDVIETSRAIFHAYNVNRAGKTPKFNTDLLKNYSDVHDRLRVRVINAATNLEFAETHVCRPQLDLLEYVVVIINSDGGQQATVAVTKKMLENWKVSEEQLFAVARHNTEKTAMVVDLSSVMFGTEQNLLEDLDEEITLGLPALVLSTKSRMFGASLMFNAKLLRWAADRLHVSKLGIIPSSVHEVIVLPEEEARGMASAIAEVNEAEVAEDEVLSDHPYMFDVKTGNITVA